jgi:ammonium transporter, Amt family
MQPSSTLLFAFVSLLALSQLSWGQQEPLPPPKVVPSDEAKKDEAKKDGEPKLSPLDEVKKVADKAAADLADAKKTLDDVKKTLDDPKSKPGDTAWMLAASAFVMLMLPGLALFYGGMVRKKNVLATMMQSMAALAVVGLYWIIVGYGLAFGPSVIKINFLGVEGGGIVGWDPSLFFLKGIETGDMLPGGSIPIYVHVMFQGMFAIITPALISGAIAERIRFWPFCIYMILWVTIVYCPLAHMVWAFDWFYADPIDPSKGLGMTAVGLLGKMGALDFAGGTVVHIAAGTAGLACALVLRRRTGYPEHTVHPNSMVLTLLGAGLLWFGWFGFTQAAAAAAGLSWIFVEWLFKGKPTALGLASGIVAGLVAVTPASGFVYMWGGAIIGLIAGVVCYFSVMLKSLFKYDDSLDAFGVHAVGGFLGAVLTGFFCYVAVNSTGADGFFAVKSLPARPDAIKKELEPLKAEIKPLKDGVDEADKAVKAAEEKLEKAMGDDKAAAEKAVADAKTAQKYAADKLGRRTDKVTKLRDELSGLLGEAGVEKLTKSKESEKLGLEWSKDDLEKFKGKDGTLEEYKAAGRDPMFQPKIQFKAALFSTVFSFTLSLALAIVVQIITLGNFSTDRKSELEGLDETEHGEVGFDFTGAYSAPSSGGAEPKAAKVPPGQKHFDVVVEGIDNGGLIKAWSELCLPTDQPIDPDFKAVYPYVTTVQGNRFRLRGGDPARVSSSIQKLFSKKLGRVLKVRVEE